MMRTNYYRSELAVISFIIILIEVNIFEVWNNICIDFPLHTHVSVWFAPQQPSFLIITKQETAPPVSCSTQLHILGSSWTPVNPSWCIHWDWQVAKQRRLFLRMSYSQLAIRFITLNTCAAVYHSSKRAALLIIITIIILIITRAVTLWLISAAGEALHEALSYLLTFVYSLISRCKALSYDKTKIFWFYPRVTVSTVKAEHHSVPVLPEF